jgi:hypothetical protein
METAFRGRPSIVLMRKDLPWVAGLACICVIIGLAACQSAKQKTEITDPNAAFSRSEANSNTTQEPSAGSRRGRGLRGANSNVGAGGE